MRQRVEQFVRSDTVDDTVRRALARCWVSVTNDGGAAGFPFPPVRLTDVLPAIDRLVSELDTGRSRLLVATDSEDLLGWLVLRRGADPLVEHSGSVHHVQSDPRFRGRGVGTRLMRRAHEVARDEFGLEQLHLTVRAGMGLEDFYRRFGWRQVGRWPGALRFSAGDYRDEVLMQLRPL